MPKEVVGGIICMTITAACAAVAIYAGVTGAAIVASGFGGIAVFAGMLSMVSMIEDIVSRYTKPPE